MRFTFLCFLLMPVFCAANAQQDSSAKAKTSTYYSHYRPDSMVVALAAREQFLADSFGMAMLIPDSLRENQFFTQSSKNSLPDAWSLIAMHFKPKGTLKSGTIRNARDPWIIGTIIGLLIYTALLNLFFGSDMRSVIQSFYSKNALSQGDKEGGLISSWAFIGLFILFSLAFGLVLYQLTVYYNVYYNINDFQRFITLSVVVALLFAVKFLVLKFIGFVFDIKRPVSQYIAILNMTYFNIAFVFLIVTVCFSLIDSKFIPVLLMITWVSITIIFAWQFLRNSVNIISEFRFHKFYLFIYLCALEICPVLILIKALDI
jgi:hypothetical protein